MKHPPINSYKFQYFNAYQSNTHINQFLYVIFSLIEEKKKDLAAALLPFSSPRQCGNGEGQGQHIWVEYFVLFKKTIKYRQIISNLLRKKKTPKIINICVKKYFPLVPRVLHARQTREVKMRQAYQWSKLINDSEGVARMLLRYKLREEQ